MSTIPLYNPLAPEVLDSLLSIGFYRMRQTVFTTSFAVTDDEEIIEVFWLRIRLRGYVPGKRHRELNRRCKRFRCTLLDAVITDEIETLYACYKSNVRFQAPGSAADFLMGESKENFFPSRMWEVRDGDRLIAIGYFDEGSDSSAGILNFYHPDYRKFSLSKWLYLESVRYAAGTGKTYFYPGYIALYFPKFDYKLEAGRERAEVWQPEKGIWTPYSQSDHAAQFSEGLIY